jgi:hypothetical protein
MMPKPQPAGDDLLPYRRLVELQKQMIEMAHQHEQARRACDVLREQMAGEIIARQRARRSPLHRLQQSTLRLFKRLASFALGAAQLNPFRSTPASSC